MERSAAPDPYLEAKILGILLAGGFAQTRDDCKRQARLRQELRPSGLHRLESPGTEPPPKA